MKRFRAFFSEERQKLAGLSLSQKRQYIWQYYKLWIVGAAALLWFLGFAGYRWFAVPRENWFFALFTNTYSDVGNGSELWRDFADYAGYDLREKKLEFNASSYFDLTKAGGAVNSYYEGFVAFADSGALDVVVMEQPEQLAAVGATGRLLDLNREECGALREKYAERLIYTTPNDESYGERVPVGIDVSDSLLTGKYRVYGAQRCVLGIGAHSTHLEAVETFLAFIMQEE